MKKWLVLLLILALALCLLCACGEDELQDGENVIAVINGQEVGDTVYNFYYNYNMDSISGYGLEEGSDLQKYFFSNVESYAWQTAIGSVYAQLACEELGIKVTEKDIDEYFDANFRAYFQTDEDLQDWLTESGYTEDEWREVIKSQLYSERFQAHLEEGVEISDEDIAAEYEANAANYDTRRVSHILISAAEGEASEEEMVQAELTARGIIRQLDDGADFAELAKEYSADGSADNGGVLDYDITREDARLVPGFVAGSWALENIGDYSEEPVKTEFGYHIIRLDSEKIGLEANQEEIAAALREEAVSQAYSDYMEDFISKSTYERVLEFQYWDGSGDPFLALTGGAPAEEGTEAGDAEDEAADTEEAVKEDVEGNGEEGVSAE